MTDIAIESEIREDRRSRRRRELHARIFRTARRLFLRRGFEATTVDQIAAAADIAPATFFNHFAGKEAVLREMAGEVFDRFAALLDEQRARDVSTAERLLGFASRGAHVVESTPELTRRVLLQVIRGSSPGETGSGVWGTQRRLAELLRDGQKRGDVRDDHGAEFLAEIVLSVAHGTIGHWVHDPTYPLHDRMREGMRFVGEALRPVAGRANP